MFYILSFVVTTKVLYFVTLYTYVSHTFSCAIYFTKRKASKMKKSVKLKIVVTLRGEMEHIEDRLGTLVAMCYF